MIKKLRGGVKLSTEEGTMVDQTRGGPLQLSTRGV
jgi:hypothetical protein